VAAQAFNDCCLVLHPQGHELHRLLPLGVDLKPTVMRAIEQRGEPASDSSQV
jgi:hypothetical protein